MASDELCMQRNIVEARRAFSFTEDADVDDSGGPIWAASLLEGGSGAVTQTSDVANKNLDAGVLELFGLREPSAGPGTVKKRLGTESRPRGRSPDLRGPTL